MTKPAKRILLISVFIPVVVWLSFCGWIVAAGLRDRVQRVDLAVVLGSAVWRGEPSPSLRARLDHTLHLYQRGLFQYVLVSGGIGVEGYDEAQVMRQYLVERGIPASQIIVDSKGDTTFLTALHARCLMQQRGWRSALLISQYFHGARSVLAFRNFAIENIYWSHARLFLPRDVYSVIRESVGYLYYQFRSYGMPCTTFDTTDLQRE